MEDLLERLGYRPVGFRRVRRRVLRRIERRIRELGLADLDAYRRLVEEAPAERETLDGLLSITISKFYRDRALFDHLRRDVLPGLARRHGRCWSAGCASGEEPYTVAILAPGIEIVATDRDPLLLARAREGLYRASSLKDLPAEDRARAFDGEGGLFRLRAEYRANVRFRAMDVRREMPEGPFDLVFLVIVPDVTPYENRRAPLFPELIGGASLDDARVVIDTVAATKTPIMILGDTGTGKEVVARVLHDRSGRSGQFVALNCAAVPNELVDAELFGHTRGAFSGAVGARAGLFRTADEGTLFLDEIGELPAGVQAKLLRVLETEEVRAVGEDKVARVDVRIVAATNRDVDSMVDGGDFRGDLLHRLSGLRIVLPALSERIEDLPALSLHFLADTGVGITAAALERLMLHAWPGNVRELRNVVRAACEVARRQTHAEIEPADVAAVIGATSARIGQPSRESELAARVTQVLTATLGSVPDAAQKLGMSRSVLYETLRRLRIDPKAFRGK